MVTHRILHERFVIIYHYGRNYVIFITFYHENLLSAEFEEQISCIPSRLFIEL